MVKKDWDGEAEVSKGGLINRISSLIEHENHLPSEIKIIDMHKINPEKYEKGEQYRIRWDW